MRPPFAWYGGKTLLTEQVFDDIFKRTPHTTFVDVFGGSGAVVLGKTPSTLDVFNDIDRGLVNFYRVLRDKDKFEELHRRISLLPFSRDVYVDYQNTHGLVCDDEIEWAMRWYYVARTSFSGRFGASWGFAISSRSKISMYLSSIESLPEIHERLRTIQVERMDFRELIRAYDTENTLFYVDPPYMFETRQTKEGYKNEIEDDDHLDLIAMLLNIKGKFLLSGYESDIYNHFLGKPFRVIDVKSTSANRKGGDKRADDNRQECLWKNYDLSIEQLKLF